MCWVTLVGVVAYYVSSFAYGQSANLTNGKTSDSQTIDSITSNNNTNIELPFQNNDHNKPNNPTTLMKLITPITQRRNNQTGITITILT